MRQRYDASSKWLIDNYSDAILRLAGVTARWQVVNLWELSASDFLPLTDPGLAPWVPLTRIDGPPEPVLQQCRDVIDAKTTGNRRDNLLAVSQVLGSLTQDPAMLKKIFTKEGKMIESPILKELVTEAEAAAFRRVLLSKLTARFQVVPPDIGAALRLLEDPAKLESLLDSAFTAKDLDEFRAELAK